MTRTALLFTANSPHVAQAWLMLTSFRDPARGAFTGDIWVLSTDLDDSARAYLDSIDVRYFTDDMAWAEAEMNWRQTVPPQSDDDALAAFHIYRNKRMSKLIYTDWFAEHGASYDAVAICDNDLYAQRDVNGLFDLAANGCLNYTPEVYPMWPGTSLWRKDARYRQVTGQWDYDPGLYEVNIGFVTARPDVMAELFETLRERFPELPPRLIRDDRWHDQDLTRVLRWQRPDLFAEFPEDSILHLCGGGMEIVEERSPGHFVNRLTGAVPRIVHFGGGEWRNFTSVKRPYLVNPQTFYDTALQRPEQPTRIDITTADFWPGPGVLVLSGTCISDRVSEQIYLSTQGRGILGHATCAAPEEHDSRDSADWVATWDCVIQMTDLDPDDRLMATVLTDAGRIEAISGITVKPLFSVPQAQA